MYCQLERASIYYEVMGEGRPMLLIHGAGLDHRVMTGCMEPIFAGRVGWKRIYVDLPGMGKTENDESVTDSDAMLEVLLRLIDAVIGQEPFVIAGQSYGGYLARGIAFRRPEQVTGMYLLCPVIIPDKAERDLPPHTVIVRDEALMASLDPAEAAGFEAFGVVLTAETWRRNLTEISPGLALHRPHMKEKLQGEGYTFSFDGEVQSARFERPALIIAGRQDSTVGYRDAWGILENFPRATFAVLDAAGHNLQLEQDAAHRALVAEWLGRVDDRQFATG